MNRAVRFLIEFRWLVLRASIWIGGTALFAAQGKWLTAGIMFVVLGGFFWIWGTTLFLIWRRQRRHNIRADLDQADLE